MRKPITSLLFAAMALSALARISPVQPSVDFGLISEADGPVTVRTYVRNIGNQPEVILKVHPTCGCTAADFYREEFAPGDSAWIDLTYDPSGRPGKFEKGVKIYPVDGEMLRLPVTGVVLASPETIESRFPADGGLLHLSKKTLMTLSPLTQEMRSLYIDTYNSGAQPVWVLLESDDEAVSTRQFPEIVPPGEKGLTGIYIHPYKEKRTGKIEYTLRLYTSLSHDTLKDSEPVEIKVYTEK